MKPALHRDHRLSGERAAQKPAGMRFDRRQREAGNVAVFDAGFDRDSRREAPETRAEDDRNVGTTTEPRADDLGRGLDPLDGVRRLGGR